MRSPTTRRSRADTLKQVLDRQALRRLAGATSFERGTAHFASDQVGGLTSDIGSIEAHVLGTRRYDVKLWVERGRLEYSCTCPVGIDGAFCKHCVAVGLAWLGRATESVATKRAVKPAVTMDDAIQRP